MYAFLKATALGAIGAIAILGVFAVLGATALDAAHSDAVHVGLGSMSIFDFGSVHGSSSTRIGPGALVVATALGVINALAARALRPREVTVTARTAGTSRPR